MPHRTRKPPIAGSRAGSVRKALLGIGAGCGVAVLAAAILALFYYQRLTAVPSPPPEATVPAVTQAVIPPPPPPLEPLPAQVQRVERAVQAKQPHQPVELDIRADELGDLVRDRLARNGVQDLQVYFAEGTVVARGRTDLGGRQLHATIRVEPEIENGELKLPIKDAQVGTIPMPSQFRERLQKQVDSALRESPPPKTGVWLETVEVTPGRMVVTGRTTGG